MSQPFGALSEAGRARGRTLRANMASLLQRQGALLALVIVCAFAAMRYDAFLTERNVFNVLRQNSMYGLIALGMTFVILTGGIDLSVGSLVALASVVAASLTNHGMLLAVLAATAAAALLGLVNGLIIAKARIQPFIVTLAMMMAARGLALAATGEKSVGVKSVSAAFTWLGYGHLGPVPVPVIIFIACYVMGWFVLNYTPFGRHVYALGDNEEAARLMGLNVKRVTLGVYTISGALSGLSGAILASRLSAGQPVEGRGWELIAIAAVVVGGTLLTGGQGGAGSTFVGVLLLGLVFNIFNLEGSITPWWQDVLRGLFLLAVVIVQNRLKARQ